MAVNTKPVVVGVSGASGSVMAKGTVDALLNRDVPVALVCTAAGRMVWAEEMDEPYATALATWKESPYFTEYAIGDLRAPIASGSYPTRGMVVVPCSMNSLASMAHGISDNLLLRTADVCLKERRPLVIVPRETPLHSGHLENMLKVSQLGAMVLTDIRVGAAFPTDHPLHVGPPALMPRPEVMGRLANADVILSLDWVDLAGILGQTWPDGSCPATVIQVSMDHHIHNGWSFDHLALPPVDIHLATHPDVAGGPRWC